MKKRILTEKDIEEFRTRLEREEKSGATVKKYLRDVRAFLALAGDRAVTKELVMEWKESLLSKNYAAASVNSMMAGLNSLLESRGWGDCRVKNLKVQRQTYSTEDQELTRAEYERLLKAAEDQPQLRLVMETLCGTGIRVLELPSFTVETVRRGRIDIRNKGKIRTILIPGKLKRKLLDWAKMKKLCGAAGVKEEKVFPHNLRKLFARSFYSVKKDIAGLADVLGHSSIDTTRIYIRTTGSEHRRVLDRLGLVQ